MGSHPVVDELQQSTVVLSDFSPRLSPSRPVLIESERGN
jgi:hypothetical protein